MAIKAVEPIQNEEQKGTFVKQVLQDLKALQKLLERGEFVPAKPRIGSELEVNVLNEYFQPSYQGYDIYKNLDNERITTEYARFNLEINSDPLLLSPNGFSDMKENLDGYFSILQKEADKHDLHLLLTGIAPTLSRRHISKEALTPQDRYETLYDIRKELHGSGYEVNIKGIDELIIHDNVLLFAGCMTSFQMHLEIAAANVIDKYNWAQLISGPLLAASSCSPLFLGKKLWNETRIALFQQSTDTRQRNEKLLEKQSRVTFGEKWIEDSILELFQQDLVDFEPLFRNKTTENSLQKIEQGKTPELSAWNVFNSSIYRWNRICYDVTQDNKPSLRIENRILPAGPTMEDQIANMAFWVGMMNGMPDEYRNLQDKIHFDKVKQNFMKAAHVGLEVQFHWPGEELISAKKLILDKLLPIAEKGLKSAGVDEKEARRYLDIIHKRVESGQTGSQWILNSYNQLEKEYKEEDALASLTSAMLSRQRKGDPVHTWEPIEAPPARSSPATPFDKVYEVMSSNPHKISEDTVVDLAAHIMKWKSIGHILVENEDNELVGILNKSAIVNYLINGAKDDEPVAVSEIMFKNPETIEPDAPIEDAIDLFLEHDLSCLPVVDNKRAVGIITNQDFISISKYLIAEKTNTTNENN